MGQAKAHLLIITRKKLLETMVAMHHRHLPSFRCLFTIPGTPNRTMKTCPNGSLIACSLNTASPALEVYNKRNFLLWVFFCGTNFSSRFGSINLLIMHLIKEISFVEVPFLLHLVWFSLVSFVSMTNIITFKDFELRLISQMEEK